MNIQMDDCQAMCKNRNSTTSCSKQSRKQVHKHYGSDPKEPGLDQLLSVALFLFLLLAVGQLVSAKHALLTKHLGYPFVCQSHCDSSVLPISKWSICYPFLFFKYNVYVTHLLSLTLSPTLIVADSYYTKLFIYIFVVIWLAFLYFYAKGGKKYLYLLLSCSPVEHHINVLNMSIMHKHGGIQK